MKEIDFVKSFINKYKEIGCAWSPNSSTQSEYADCEIIYGGYHIQIEAKMFDDTRNNSNKFHELLGELIVDRKRKKMIQCSCREFYLGILLQSKREKEFTIYWDRIADIDKVAFCKDFGLKYLFLYDKESKSQWLEVKKFDSSSGNFCSSKTYPLTSN